MRQAIVGQGGTEMGTEGDSFFAVFPSATAAVRAAAVAQRDLTAADWPAGVSLGVRMGLHTGEGRLGGDGYVGLDVHRAARIAAAGYGGQVLLSDVTRALVEQDLPDGVALRSLGAHRLKDLPVAERIWQLDIAGLQQEFGALRSIDARPNNVLFDTRGRRVHLPLEEMAADASATFWPAGAIQAGVAGGIGGVIAVVAWLLGIPLLSGPLVLIGGFMFVMAVFTFIHEGRKAARARRTGGESPPGG